jgi:predicted NUDIX family NTP pyrophosphohydrolase
MPKPSAGILLYRFNDGEPEVLLIHPGGPFWKNKDVGAWSIPKGQIEGGDEPLATAVRELEEEIGLKVAHGSNFITLRSIRQAGGKLVHCFALNHDFDPATLTSNTFKREWPPHSGKQAEFPEVDRAEWFDFDTAKEKIIPAQADLIDQLADHVG